LYLSFDQQAGGLDIVRLKIEKFIGVRLSGGSMLLVMKEARVINLLNGEVG